VSYGRPGAVECAEIRFVHRPGVEEWWSAAASGLATIGLILTAQDAGTVVRVRREYDRIAAAEYADGGELVLDHGALLVGATAGERPRVSRPRW
jgi:hypothetical protein